MNNSRLAHFFRKLIARNFFPLIDFLVCVTFKFKKITNPTIILTPGKVGSSSVYETIKTKQKEVYHLHNLTKNSIQKSIELNKSSYRKYIPMHLIISKHILKHIKEVDLKIICLIRDPINREISSLFQNIEMFDGLSSKTLRINKKKIKHFITKRLSHEKYLLDLESWFEIELLENFGLNFMEFDLKKGFYFVERGRLKFLFMRVEELESNFENAYKELYNTSNTLKLKKVNIGNTKYYNEYYRDLKDNLPLGDFRKLDFYKNNNIVKRFYSNNEK